MEAKAASSGFGCIRLLATRYFLQRERNVGKARYEWSAWAVARHAGFSMNKACAKVVCRHALARMWAWVWMHRGGMYTE